MKRDRIARLLTPSLGEDQALERANNISQVFEGEPAPTTEVLDALAYQMCALPPSLGRPFIVLAVTDAWLMDDSSPDVCRQCRQSYLPFPDSQHPEICGNCTWNNEHPEAQPEGEREG